MSSIDHVERSTFYEHESCVLRYNMFLFSLNISINNRNSYSSGIRDREQKIERNKMCEASVTQLIPFFFISPSVLNSYYYCTHINVRIISPTIYSLFMVRIICVVVYATIRSSFLVAKQRTTNGKHTTIFIC